MNHKCNQYYLQLRTLLLLALAAVWFTACDSTIYDDEGDCSVVYKVRFRYDMNLKWADAFANEVKSVHLYAYDQEGTLVWQREESGSLLGQEGYAMTLDLQPGKYHLVAWCGLSNDGSRPESFTVPGVTEGEKNMEWLKATLNHGRTDDGRAMSDSRLWSLYHGETDVEILSDDEAEPGTYYETLSLTKDTNHLRIILHNTAAEDLDPDDFVFELVADNGHLDCHNGVIPTEDILYRTWSTKAGEAGVGKVDSRASIVNVKGVIADFTLSRMMADQRDKVMLKIYNKDKSKVVGNIPVIDYALLSKDFYEDEYRKTMTDQEFLDREDDYVMTFFMDEDHTWGATQVLIHSWRLVIQHIDLD